MATTSQDLLLSSITAFYNKSPEYTLLLDKIIHGEYTISLRVIDWFITHYTRDKNVIICIKDNKLVDGTIDLKDVKKFNIYLEYRTQLKSYTKMFFDPFRRHQRIAFEISKAKVFETTIGQINFFRWIFQNAILQYIEKYQENIEDEMTRFQSIKKNVLPVMILEKGEISTKGEKHPRKNIQNTRINTSCYVRFD